MLWCYKESGGVGLASVLPMDAGISYAVYRRPTDRITRTEIPRKHSLISHSLLCFTASRFGNLEFSITIHILQFCCFYGNRK